MGQNCCCVFVVAVGKVVWGLRGDGEEGWRGCVWYTAAVGGISVGMFERGRVQWDLSGTVSQALVYSNILSRGCDDEARQ